MRYTRGGRDHVYIPLCSFAHSLFSLQLLYASQFKAKGNAALQAGNATEAIEHYTKAIQLDGANHVYFSNRSAAYLSQGDAHNALEDANACLGLKPDFAKGYSRKGAALHALKRYNDSITAYEAGLVQFPGDPGLTKGLADVKREKEDPFGTAAASSGASGGLFGPQMMAQMALDPRLRPYLSDPEIMGKIKQVQQNPNLLPSILQDPKMMEFLGLMMGQEIEEDQDTPSSATAPRANNAGTKNQEPEPMEEEEEDLSHLSPEEQKIKEQQKAAVTKKEEGNSLYKTKKFDEALAAYDEAVALDPTNMTFLSNKAAVYFSIKKYDECIEACLAAVEVGKENRAPFEDRAKALTRAAKAYQKKGDLGKAIELCEQAQLESFDKETQRLLKTMELEKKKAETAAYLSDEKADEAKQRGNDFFRDKQWSQAVAEYEEAVKRAPKNAAIRNNLAAALCKIMDFSGAQRQIETALDLDPQYVKAWARKGDIEMYMKEYHKAQESYKKGLMLDADNTACKDGLRKCLIAISYGRSNMTDEEKKEQAAHSMADPEIQAILHDPVMQQVLKDLQENPASGQQALKDPMMRAKLEKLIAAGIIETR
jgi:stress-induced-phosphoprotein 1